MTKEYKIQYLPTGNIFTLPKEECDRLVSESECNYKVLDADYSFTPKKQEKKSSVAQKVLGDENPKNPYEGMKQDVLDAELTKRGIDFKALKAKSNKDKVVLLLKNDKEKAEVEAKFGALKVEATALEVEITEDDTLETLQVKVDAKKAEVEG